MSSSSSESGNKTKAYKLKSRKHFPIWKQKTLATANLKGFAKYLTQNVTISSEADIDLKEMDYINEVDDGKRRKLKGELSQMKRIRQKSLDAAEMLTNSVRSKELKMLGKCKHNPKAMFEKICKNYGTEEEIDLTDLLEDFNTCKLGSKKKDQEDWFA